MLYAVVRGRISQITNLLYDTVFLIHEKNNNHILLLVCDMIDQSTTFFFSGPTLPYPISPF